VDKLIRYDIMIFSAPIIITFFVIYIGINDIFLSIILLIYMAFFFFNIKNHIFISVSCITCAIACILSISENYIIGTDYLYSIFFILSIIMFLIHKSIKIGL
jgi:hypothetical protein